MADRIRMLERLSTVFDENKSQELADVFHSSCNDLVRPEDFTGLKEIVAIRQKRNCALSKTSRRWQRRKSGWSKELKKWEM